MAGMVRCKNDLHFYDSSKHGACPYCRDQDEPQDSTASFSSGGGSETEDLSTTQVDSSIGKPKPKPKPTQRNYESGSTTIGFFKKQAGFEPVVGWLVCTDGSPKGRDYRIKPGVNKIGRSETQDIYISGDKTISRENHAQILYYQEENAFHLVRGENITVKVDGKNVLQTVELHSHDTIQLGETQFIFVPLCNEGFKWVLDDPQKKS